MRKIAISIMVLGGLLSGFAENVDTKFDSLFEKYAKIELTKVNIFIG